MTSYYAIVKPAGVLGATALGLEFNLGGLSVGLTLYWLRPIRNASNQIISGNKYFARLATDERTLWHGHLMANDPVIRKNVFDFPEEPDLMVICATNHADGINPETLANGEANITVIAGTF